MSVDTGHTELLHAAVDYGIILAGLAAPVYVLVASIIRKNEVPTAADLLAALIKGAGSIPFLFMMIGAFHKEMLDYFFDSKKEYLFFGGLLGLVCFWKADDWLRQALATPRNAQSPPPGH